MLKTKLAVSAALIIAMLSSTSALTLAASDKDIKALRAETQNMKQIYEGRIAELESKLNKIEKTQAKAVVPTPAIPATARRNIKNNIFNPSIGIILNGQYNHLLSNKDKDEDERMSESEADHDDHDGHDHDGDHSGHKHEGEHSHSHEGFTVDHTELNFSANVDDKFFGSTTAAIAQHEGEIELELEEAYVQTLPGMGLPNGMSVKAGRAFWTLGYLNEHHSHADDFADRPLPYRKFLNEAFNYDGAEASYVLPIDFFYSEIGGGLFRNNDLPSKNESHIEAWSAFTRVGGDIGNNHSWRLGGYFRSSQLKDDADKDEHDEHRDEGEHRDENDIYAADFRYTWAPTGNAREQEVTLQAEYFQRKYTADIKRNGVKVSFDDPSGWYAQAVYKFDPQWRVGVRYSQLNVPNSAPGSDEDENKGNQKTHGASAMLDWTNSEFSRIRLQYNYEKLADGHDDHGDHQVTLQYIMSLGAHGAHKY